MSVYHGKAAKVDLGGVIEATLGWSLTTSADVAEATDMGDTWKTFEPGFDDVTATVEGNARTTRDTITQIGSEATLKLYIDATNYFSFNAICTGITETASKDDIGKISYSFEMDDAAGLAYN